MTEPMVATMAVRKRCPRHGALLAYEAESGLWKCPVVGCNYAIPGDPPAET